MLIYFLRHGDASSEPQYNDSERPLTEIGKNQASIAGKYLLKKKIAIDTILHSPLTRAQQTADIVNSYINSKIIFATEYLVNNTNQTQLLQQLNELNVQSVLLVGHIPHIPETISLLTDGTYEDAYEIKKCSLAIVETDFPIKPGKGKLLQIIRNEEMTIII